MIEDLSRVLSEHPFVQGMAAEHVHFLTGCTANIKFQPGDYLFREGEPASVLYLLREGEAAVQVYSPGRGARTLVTINGGDIAGWSWVVKPYTCHFDVVAISPVRAISIDAACLRRKCDADPKFGYDVLTRMVTVIEHRLQASRLQLLDIYGTPR